MNHKALGINISKEPPTTEEISQEIKRLDTNLRLKWLLQIKFFAIAALVISQLFYFGPIMFVIFLIMALTIIRYIYGMVEFYYNMEFIKKERTEIEPFDKEKERDTWGQVLELRKNLFTINKYIQKVESMNRELTVSEVTAIKRYGNYNKEFNIYVGYLKQQRSPDHVCTGNCNHGDIYNTPEINNNFI